ncbi:hypothetical protein ABZV64_00060 [Streptomyces sp. NPDC004959]|uniref:hypothetical protein n=1 Tax=unclassified Streptomyces TaxID=2593676 RepID=UPI0004C77337|nr:hypothetical protein [Streptomyces sp. NRRL F-5630]
MAENGAEREESREPEESGVPPLDEEAAWAAIVAGYGEEPADPPGAKPFKSVDDLAGLEARSRNERRDAPAEEPGEDEEPPGRTPLGGSVAFAPGVRGGPPPGPRDHTPAEEDEGHFVPPDPQLPESDVTAKFAWLAVIGGPVLTLLAVLFDWDMTWWLATLCIGGFVGGFVTLVIRMGAGDDEDEDDPGRGAVV